MKQITRRDLAHLFKEFIERLNESIENDETINFSYGEVEGNFNGFDFKGKSENSYMGFGLPYSDHYAGIFYIKKNRNYYFKYFENIFSTKYDKTMVLKEDDLKLLPKKALGRIQDTLIYKDDVEVNGSKLK
jgi:hypothetical protein